MKASNVKIETLQYAADNIGVVLDYSPHGYQFRVKVNPGKPNKYPRISPHGRKVAAVCWHGFRDFFRAVYCVEPNAKFVTAFDTWQNSEDFEKRFAATGLRNVGSEMYPMRAAAACTCPESGFAQ